MAAAAVLYGQAGGSWVMFLLLFFVPDVSFAGYLGGPRVGAVIYNMVHSYAAPLAATLVLLVAGSSLTLPLIWFAHIGFDRALGYGLKYPSSFHDTHLGRIGREKAPRG